MKKFSIYYLFIIPLLFVKCTDLTNEYANQLFTDIELNRAFRQGLVQCADTSNAHLMIPDSVPMGFYHYDEGHYRILLPTQLAHVDTLLRANGYGGTLDSLYWKTNHAASLNGNSMKAFYNELFPTVNFAEPYKLLRGDSTAVVTYFETHYYGSVYSRVLTVAQPWLTAHGVNTLWEQVQQAYYDLSGQFIALNYNEYVAQSITAAIFEEMKREEVLIRRDSSHRGPQSGKLYEVFSSKY
jgi:hypothetical protein